MRAVLSERATRAVLLASIVLSGAVVLPDVPGPLKLACLAVFVVMFLPVHRLRARPAMWLPLAAYGGLLAFAALRYLGNPVGPSGTTVILMVITLATMVAWLVRTLWAARPAPIIRDRLVCAALSPVVFAVTNLALWALGFRSSTGSAADADQGVSTLLGSLGVNIDRAALPLTPGLNGGGAMAALGAVIAVVFALYGEGKARRFCQIAAPLCIASVLLTDSRGALLFMVVTLIGVAAIPRQASRSFTAIAVLLPFAPAIVLAVVDRLGGFAAELSRNPGDFATATGRADVWSTIGETTTGSIQALVGWGLYGQAESGASRGYAYIFPSSDNPLLATAHNAGLQTILDTGYIGLIAFAWLVVAAIGGAATAYRQTRRPESLAALAGLVCVVLMGATEAIPSVYTFYSLAAFAVLSVAGMAVRVEAAATVPLYRPIRLRRAMPALAFGVWLVLAVGTISLMRF